MSTEEGEYANLHRTIGDGEYVAKKISYRIEKAGARETQYRVIYHQRQEYEVKAMCKFFGLSRAAYYAWVKRLCQPDPDQDQMELVQEAYRKSRRTYGYRRVTLWIRKNKGIFINHKAVLRLMGKLNIHSVTRKCKMHIRLT